MDPHPIPLPSGTQRARARLRTLLGYHRSGEYYEIGFGGGDLFRQAAQHYSVRGCDLSTAAVARMPGPLAGRVVHGDITRLDLPRAAYDVVAAYNVLEHIPDPAPVIAKVYAGLRPGGILAGSMPNKAGVIGRVHTALTNIFDRTHCSTFTPARWRDLFSRAGFGRIHFFGEVMPANKNYCLYVTNRCWPYLSFNLVFVCVK